MTEAEARPVLAAFDGLGGLERWISEQRSWQAVPGGWTAISRAGPSSWKVRVVASAGRGEPAVWFVPCGRKAGG